MTPKEYLELVREKIQEKISEKSSKVLKESDFKIIALNLVQKEIKESEYIESFNDFEFCKEDTYGSNFWKAVKEELETNY
jgi:hypothetical protein